MCHAAPPAAEHTVTVAVAVTGGLYAIAAASATIFVVIPRMLAGRAAASAGRPAVGLSRAVRAARLRQRGMRWSPSYGEGLARMRPGYYVQRNGFEMTRVPAARNHGFFLPNQVSL